MSDTPSVQSVPVPPPPPAPPADNFRAHSDEPTRSELARFKAFIFIQILFLGASPLAGGFNFKVWSMADTALLILSLGLCP